MVCVFFTGKMKRYPRWKITIIIFANTYLIPLFFCPIIIYICAFNWESIRANLLYALWNMHNFYGQSIVHSFPAYRFNSSRYIQSSRYSDRHVKQTSSILTAQKSVNGCIRLIFRRNGNTGQISAIIERRSGHIVKSLRLNIFYIFANMDGIDIFISLEGAAIYESYIIRADNLLNYLFPQITVAKCVLINSRHTIRKADIL